jgi:hypothetical protein
MALLETYREQSRGFQMALSVVQATGGAFQCAYIILDNIDRQAKYVA